jgi:hypothetical protein
MFEFNVRDGILTHNGESISGGNTVYSGHGAGLNNPDMETVRGEGPLPRGEYRIGPAYDDPHLGPCVMHLDPMPGTNEFGRSLFRMHGDNAELDHTASDGCVIAAHDIRKLVATSQDKFLKVF